MNDKIYGSLKIEVEGGQYVKAEMITKVDYAFFAVKKITQEQHLELLELIETCADPNYTPVKTLADKVAELEIEALDLKLCVAELTMCMFDLEDRVIMLEEGGIE